MTPPFRGINASTKAAKLALPIIPSLSWWVPQAMAGPGEAGARLTLVRIATGHAAVETS